MVTDKPEFGYNVEEYEYQTGYNVEVIMGSQFNTKRKMDLYPIKRDGDSDHTNWTEELYEIFNGKEIVREFHERNPHAANKKIL